MKNGKKSASKQGTPSVLENPQAGKAKVTGAIPPFLSTIQKGGGKKGKAGK